MAPGVFSPRLATNNLPHPIERFHLPTERVDVDRRAPRFAQATRDVEHVSRAFGMLEARLAVVAAQAG